MSKHNSNSEMEDMESKIQNGDEADANSDCDEADALALEIEEEVVFDIEEEDMSFLTDEDYKDLQGFNKQTKSQSKTPNEDEIVILSEYPEKCNYKNNKTEDLSDSRHKSKETTESFISENFLLEIPGSSFIIGINTLKDTYDCVLCYNENSSSKFIIGPEMKSHVHSRQHIINVMMVENGTLYDKYKEDKETSSKILLNEILKREKRMEPQKIVSCSLNSHKEQKEKITRRLREMLLAQLNYDSGNCITEESDAFKKSSLHITFQQKKVRRKIIKKHRNGEISSVVKMPSGDSLDSTSTELLLSSNSTSTGYNILNEQCAMKNVIAAKGPNIARINISEDTLNSTTETELLVGEGLILKENKKMVSLFDKKHAESQLPDLSSHPNVIKDETDVIEKEVLHLLEKEVLDRVKLIETGSNIPKEAKVKVVKKYSEADLIDVQQFASRIGLIRKFQKERLPSKIVIVTDDRDNFDISLAGFNENVDVMKIPGLNYANAFPSIKSHPNFGKGTLYVISCGTHDLLISVLLQDCLMASCPCPQTMLSIPVGNKDVHYLIEKALELNKNILDATKNDIVLFCGLIPVHVAKYNRYTKKNRPCNLNHPALHEPPSGLPLFKEYEKAILLFNSFTKLHSQMLGFTPWDWDEEYFTTKQCLLANAYNLTPIEVTNRTNLAKSRCEEILIKFKATAGCALGQVKKSNLHKYDQVVIITDDRYIPYLKTLKDEFLCTIIPNYTIEELERNLLGKIDFSIGKTLLLLVVGIHTVALEEPAKFCVNANCDDPLLALTPFTNKKWAKLFEKIIAKHKYLLNKYSDSLPVGSHMCVLPPLPIAVIGKQSHRGLHEMYFECPNYKVLNNLGDFSRWYPIWIDKMIDYSRSTFLECDPSNRVWSGQKFKLPPSYREVNLVMRKGGPITYNTWKNSVKQLANTALKDLTTDVSTSSSNLKQDYLVIIAPASTFAQLPDIGEKFNRWTFEDITQSDKLVRKIKNLNRHHRENGFERFLFIVISDVSMMGFEEINTECYRCEQKLRYTTLLDDHTPMIAKINDSITVINNLWRDVNEHCKFQSKIIIAPFTPREYIIISNFELFHSKMHSIVKDHVGAVFLKGGTRKLWEDNLIIFAEEWKKLALLIQKESRDIIHLKNIESSFKLKTITTCGDIVTSEISHKDDSAIKEWRSCIKTYVTKGWVTSVDTSASDKTAYQASQPYNLPGPTIQHHTNVPFPIPGPGIQQEPNSYYGAVNNEFGMAPGIYDTQNNINQIPYQQPAPHQFPPTPFQPPFGDQYPRMPNPNSVQTYSAPPLNYQNNQPPPLPVPPPHRPMIPPQHLTVPLQQMAVPPQPNLMPLQPPAVHINLPPQQQMPIQPTINVPPIANIYNPNFNQTITSEPGIKGQISNTEINRNLSEVIQFTQTIKRSSRKFQDNSFAPRFENAFIVGARELISPLLECNIKSTMIYHDFAMFEESDIQSLLYKMGNFRGKSVCCLVFDLSVITSKLVMSPACFRHSCQQPLLVTALEPYSLNNDKALNSLFYSKIQSISKFIRKLTQHISVVVLPFSPTRFYCEDTIVQSHHDSHTISKLGFPVVFGPQAKWEKVIESLNISLNDLIDITNKNFDPESLISNYIASKPSTFLMLKNVIDFVTPWTEPDIWKAFAETFLQSLVPMKVSLNGNKKTSISSWPEKTSVIVSQVSPSIPFKFFVELFTSADRQVEIVEERDTFTLHGMTPGRASLLVKKLNSYRIGDTVLRASLVGKSGDEDSEFNLIQRLYISTIFEQIYQKWKPEIINNLIKKVNEVPNAATLKTLRCEKGIDCRDSKLCIYHHGSQDTRRNPLLNDYTDIVCLKAKKADGLCREGIYCRLSHNVYESNYLPYKYQVRVCPSGTSKNCNSRELCPNAHKDSPEMLYTSDWEDLIMVGPQESLNFFTGAIRAFSKVEQVHRHNLKVLLISPSTEFLDIAIKASADLLKIYGLTVSSFYSSNASPLDNNTSYPDSCQVLVGTPSAFVNLSSNIFREKKGTIIIDDVQKIIENDRYRDDMKLFFHNVVLSKVFVCTSFDTRLVSDISSIAGSQMKLVYHPTTDYSDVTPAKVEKRNYSSEATDYGNKNKKLCPDSRTSSRSNSWQAKSRFSDRRSRSRERSLKDKYPDNDSSYQKSARQVRLSPPTVVGRPQTTKEPFMKLDKQEEELSKRFGKQLYDDYKRTLAKIQEEFEMDFGVYNNMPELYPNYLTHYHSFATMYNMQNVSKDDPHKERLWKLYWRSKFDDIKKEDWAAKQKELIEDFEKKASRPKHPNFSHNFREAEAPRNYNSMQPDLRNSFSRSKEDSSFSFEGTLSLIERLSGGLGFLGPSVNAIIKSCRDKGIATKEAYHMFTESENVMLVNMVFEKLKSQFQSTSGENRRLYEKAIDWIPRFLIEAKKGPPQVLASNVDNITVDLQAIARASVGKGSKFALDLIKTALAYEGVENPTKEMINGLFLKVCEIHFTLSIDE